MLTVQNVTKRFGKFTVLEDISLEFNSGVYGLLAPNGAGKTTLMKMLVTLLFPTGGKILYNGTDIRALGADYREKLGYLPQDFGYYRNSSPRQYLRYLGALKGLERKAVEKRADELLEMVGLPDVKDKKMKKFSGGMVQRVGIAQAMLNDPEILILDEPTAGLDPKERVRFRNILTELSKDRVVILSTHIVSDIESIANRVIFIKDHTVYCDTDRDSLCRILEGKVYECAMPQQDADRFGQNCFVLSKREEPGQTRFRFVCEKPENLPPEAKPSAPGMEDVFLYVYRED
jgi:ABC-type multidrug transport system ATPase subunit